MKFKCAHCGRTRDKAASHFNRSRALGLRLFCGRKCFGLDRRKNKTKAQKIAEKRKYDKEYRRKNRATLKVKKRAYHVRTYDPAKQRAYNQQRKPLHVEYCRRPEYKRWKSEYDRQHRAAEFGAFAEAYRLTIDLNREIKGRATNEQIQWANGTLNKSQTRRRQTNEERPRSRPRPREHRDRNKAPVG